MAKDNEKTIIERTAQVTAEKVVLEFQKKGLLKDNKQSAFQKTEILLYNYNSFKDAIKEKRKQIKEVKSYGTKEKSKSITSFSSGGSFDIKDEDEKIEDKVKQLENSITITKNFIKVIDSALDKIKDDKYFEIIKLKYLEGKKREEMAEVLDCDEKTISRNKNRLINKLKIDLFSDESITEMFK